MREAGTGQRVAQFHERLMMMMMKYKDKIYRYIILPVVLYGCETWSLTLREERKLKFFNDL